MYTTFYEDRFFYYAIQIKEWIYIGLQDNYTKLVSNAYV